MEYREEEDNNIAIFGAREHNLKNIDLTIPRDKLTVITGLSGSGNVLRSERPPRFMTFCVYFMPVQGWLTRTLQVVRW